MKRNMRKLELLGKVLSAIFILLYTEPHTYLGIAWEVYLHNQIF